MKGMAGVVLAGGLARRMGGGDKGERLLGGRPLLDRVVERAGPQVSALAINANGDPGRFSRFGLPVLADPLPDHPGPLAGVLAGLRWASSLPGMDLVASFACDAPFLPTDLVAKLAVTLREEGAEIALAASGDQVHPVFGLWPVALADDLARAMTEEGIRKVDVWTARHRTVVVPFPIGAVDPFFNANRPEDLSEAEALVEQLDRAAR